MCRIQADVHVAVDGGGQNAGIADLKFAIGADILGAGGNACGFVGALLRGAWGGRVHDTLDAFGKNAIGAQALCARRGALGGIGAKLGLAWDGIGIDAVGASLKIPILTAVICARRFAGCFFGVACV